VSDSILNKHRRQPKIYVDVPSEFRYCDEKAYSGTSKEVPVYSMTGANEIMMKNPEALLNGEAVKNLIQSCIPSINNTGLLSSIDVEFLLMAIRIATYGETYKKSSTCPHCEEVNTYDINLSSYIDSYATKEWVDNVTVDDLTFYIRPHNYDKFTQLQKLIFQAQRTIAQLATIENISEDERLKLESDVVNTLEDINKQNIIEQVYMIKTPEGEETNAEIARNFVLEEDRKYFQALKELTVKNTKVWDVPDLELTCGSCGKEYTSIFAMDDSNFFAE